MKLAILQLSDIHFQPTKKFVLSRTSQIAGAVTAANLDWTDILIVLSGDIAFSGGKHEYAIASDFVADLKTKLLQSKPTARMRIVAVPGNHDCDYKSSENSTRKMILGYLQSNPKDLYAETQPLKHLLSVQASFEEFRASISTDPGDDSDGTRVSQTLDLDYGATRIRVHLLNTALACNHHTAKGETDQGRLFVPLHMLSKGSVATCDTYCITVMHHPLNWMESTNAVDLGHAISSTSDLILTGHQHEEDAESKDWINKEKNLWVRATALQDETGSSSGFNLITVDTDSLEEAVYQYKWNGEFYEIALQRSWTKSESQRTNRRQIPLNEDARAKLDDPGTGFTHPSKKQLHLDDLFVAPKLRALLGADEKADDASGDTSDSVQNFTRRKLTIILGEPRSGKTTLLKRIFKEVYNSAENITPLTIEGADINASHLSIDRLWRLVERNFKQTFPSKSLDNYSQLHPDSRMLFIDNWQGCQLNDAGRRDLLEVIEKRFSRILLLADESVKLENISAYTEHFADLLSFAVYRIEPFGHLLRAKLIRKWLLFSREKTVTQQSLHEEIHKAEAVMNTVLGKNLMPSYPFFVLSLLQLDQNIKTTNHANGSYGYIYESLITMALAEVSRESTEIDVYYTILGRLAWELHATNSDSISAVDLARVIRDYAEEYKSLVDPVDITNKLLKAKLLASSEGQYFFRYKYIYCFFTARFLADSLKTPDTAEESRKVMIGLTDSITVEESANIIIFLIYFTRDGELIEKLLSNAKNLFASAPLFDADTSMAFLAPAVEQYVKTARPVVRNSPEVNRDHERQSLDIAAEEEKSRAERKKSDAGANTEFAQAMKLLDILGQIVRNFPGSMPGKVKVKITSEVYRLGLRVATKAVTSVEEDVPKFRAFVKKGILSNEKSQSGRKWSEEDLNKRADQLTVVFLGIVTLGIVKAITSAVGLAQLRPTYDEVKTSNSFKDNPAIDLIDLSISLDHGTEFPKPKILRLWDSMRDKWFGQLVIKQLVAYHFRMFYVERSVAKSVGEKLELDMRQPEIKLRMAAGRRPEN